MSLSHKAYEFDWSSFVAELAPILQLALQEDDPHSLVRFVDEHRNSCRDLEFGEPLSAAWRESSAVGDVQVVADLALTKYYDPLEDNGLAEAWVEISSGLSSERQMSLLGDPFGPPSRLFDPGYQGSYFQTPDMVHSSLELLESISTIPAHFMEMLGRVVGKRFGLYVTF